ncbi:MAG: hypothetical protein DRQ51_09115 [Gammaproteobacteria bacterium]|nr:MAG: hypothetical protein DRQ51_09115 [Gammaproteobacteria bacterium]
MQTICPDCGYTFNIENNQLELSDGTVDCPKCEHVFNSYSGLSIKGVGTTFDTYNKLPFIMLVLVMLVLILLQALYFDSKKIINFIGFKDQINPVCEFIKCQNKIKRDVTKIKIISRDVKTHPVKKNSLIIDISAKNTANFLQPFARMVISMSNIQGEVIAQRIFLSHQYVGQKLANKGMDPDRVYKIKLPIQDPGKNVLNFEIDFIK